ncbi:MAG TPA: tRNA (adenosine(37)-N6)-threonylcarbamoyltransferase complex dimerization subunit type 1 TsaB [Verrucomicrobiae bacterium]|jgi:tRNA threonylcarbamoyladenosine biosynthesis protein TsaB|nr:tRNA (adenosine(37)-N6)-threonylcarbamoyltransferase complex dimerization subunit type 1 TsaB [Verrucomicrobiae bacterium]
MKILAVEFSSEERSVAVATDGNIRGSAMEKATRATHAFALIEQALTQARIEREQIECLAIGLGPGSYTGIRSAIALAQGWQLALPVKLLGISTVECLAAQAQSQGWFGKVNIVIDAQRDELYFARYEISSHGYREIASLRLATPDEVRLQCKSDEIIAGPDANRWFEKGRIIFPDAATLARLAASRTDFMPGEKLEPIYLRETNFVKAPPPRIFG